MKQAISLVTLLVPDYDEGIAFYVGQMGFNLLENKTLEDGRRWVVVAPPGGEGTRLLLVQAAGRKQKSRVGDQTGGPVALVLTTDSFERDFDRMRLHGVAFLEKPRREDYGIVAVFADPFGNKWDLIEPR